MNEYQWQLKYSPEQPRVPAGHTGGGQWTSGDSLPIPSHPSWIDPETVEADVKGIGQMVKHALEQDPARLGHGTYRTTTAQTAFDVVGNQVYPYGEVPRKKKQLAITFHSHGNPDYDKPGGPFQPLNAGDIHIWLSRFRTGKTGLMTGVIMPDGRMELLQITRETSPAIFKMSQKKLDAELLPPFEERTSDYRSARARLRGFATKYGLRYYEGLRWDQ